MKIFTLTPRVDLLYFNVLLVSLFFQNTQAHSSPVYTTTLLSQNNADFSGNSIDGNLSTRAKIRPSPRIADIKGF